MRLIGSRLPQSYTISGMVEISDRPSLLRHIFTAQKLTI